MVSDLLLDSAGGVEKEGLYAIVSINVERKLCGPGLLEREGMWVLERVATMSFGMA